MSRIKFLSYLISEGVRSGARDIKGFKPKKDFTIGFEFEISTPELRNGNDNDDHDNDWENFSENWYQNGSGPSPSDYWNTLEDRDITQIINLYNLKAKYGYGKKADYNKDQGYFDFYNPTREDSEDSYKVRNGIVLNSDGEEVDVFQLEDPEEFFELFKPNCYDEWTEDYFHDYEQEAMNDAFQEYLNDNSRSDNDGNSIEHIQYVMKKALKQEIYLNSDDYSSWTLVADSSIDPDGGELRSPILSYNEAINALKTVFKAISTDSELETNESTGLHINLGTFTKEELDRLDILKFVLLIGEEHVLGMFDREHNRYTEPHIEHIIKYLQQSNGNNINNYLNSISSINSHIIENPAKYRFANVGKLKDGYIEIRAAGGDNYHKKFNEVVETINRVMKFLEIAMDPNAYRKEYLTKLYKLFGDKMKGLDQMSKNRDVATNQSVISNIEKDFASVLDRKYKSIGNSIIDVIQVLVEVAVNIDKKQLQPEIMLKHSIQIRNYVNQLKKSNNNYKSMIPNAKTYINSQRDNMDKKIYTFIMGLLN